MILPYLGIEIPYNPDAVQAAKYLDDHFRYSTMNSWNGIRSFAHCIKVRKLNIPNDDGIRDRVYEMLEIEQAHDEAAAAWEQFQEKYDYSFQIGINGRSDGYAVLYKGGRRPTGHLSFCPQCGQRNFEAVNGADDVCGACHGHRVNYKSPPMTVYTMPGQSLANEWDGLDRPAELEDIMYYFDIVRDFDIAVEEYICNFVEFARTHRVEEREVLRPETIRVAVEDDADE